METHNFKNPQVEPPDHHDNDNLGNQRITFSTPDLTSEHSELYRSVLEMGEQQVNRPINDFNNIRNLSNETVSTASRSYNHLGPPFYSNLNTLQTPFNLTPGGDLHRLNGQNLVYPSQYPGAGGDASSLLYSQYSLQPRTSPSPYQTPAISQSHPSYYTNMSFAAGNTIDFASPSIIQQSQPTGQSFSSYLLQNHIQDSVPLQLRNRDVVDQQSIELGQKTPSCPPIPRPTEVIQLKAPSLKVPEVIDNIEANQMVEQIPAPMPSSCPPTPIGVLQQVTEEIDKSVTTNFQNTAPTPYLSANDIIADEHVVDNLPTHVDNDVGAHAADGNTVDSTPKEKRANLNTGCTVEEPVTESDSSALIKEGITMEQEDGISLNVTNPKLIEYSNLVSYSVTLKCKKCGFSTIKLQKFIDHFDNLRKHPKEKTRSRVSDKILPSGIKHRPKRKWATEHEQSSDKYGKHDLRKPLKKRRGIHLHKESTGKTKKLKPEKNAHVLENQTGNTAILACHTCNLQLSSQFEVEIHQKCHTDGDKDKQGCYLCDYEVSRDVVAEECSTDKMTAMWDLTQKHISSDHPEVYGNYRCKYCQIIFPSECHLNTHLMNLVSCGKCEEKFCSEKWLNTHEKMCLPEKGVDEDAPSDGEYDTTFEEEDLDDQPTRNKKNKSKKKSAVPYQKKTKNNRKMILCQVEGCNSRLATENEMGVHMSCHKGGDIALSCYLCSFKPHRKVIWSVMKRHFVSVHPGVIIAKYHCTLCDKGFSSQSQLDEHGFAHSDSREQICEQCGAGFKRPNHLAKHIDIVHKGIKYIRKKNDGSRTKVHMCHLCGHATTTKKQLTAHLNAHMNVKPHKCPECDFCASDPSTVRKHRRRHLQVKKFKCDLCDYRCNFRQNLRHHMTSSHKEMDRTPSTANDVMVKTSYDEVLKDDLQPLLSLSSTIAQSSIIDQASKIAELNQSSNVSMGMTGSNTVDIMSTQELWKTVYPSYMQLASYVQQPQNGRNSYQGDTTGMGS